MTFLKTADIRLNLITFLRKTKVILSIIFGLGILLRLLFYFAGRSLWLDELFTAFNATGEPFSQLFSPLHYEQCAPVGFIIFEKLLALSLGNNAYILRLFPLFCGLAGLGYFWLLAKRLCTRYSSAIIALTLFALSKPLIYFSAEAKPYSGDVMMAILLYLLFIRYDELKNPRLANNIFFAISACLALFFSHTSIFILISYTAILLLRYYRQRENKKLLGLTLISFAWLLVSYLLYARVYHAYFANPYLQDYWKTNFIAFGQSFFQGIQELFKIISKISFANDDFIWGGIFFICGAFSLFHGQKRRLLTLTSPMLICIILSAFHVYPIATRLLLFFAPFAIIIAAEGINFCKIIMIKRPLAAANFFVGIMITLLLLNSSELISKPADAVCRPIQETAPVIEYIAKHKQPDDAVCGFEEARYALKYYGKRWGIKKFFVIKGKLKKDPYEEIFAALKNKKRTWILFVFFYEDADSDYEQNQKGEIVYLDSIGKRLDSFKKSGAAVYLYDFSR